MANLEAKFEALEAQLTTQNTAIINALDSILTALGAPPPTATVTLGDTLAMMVALNNNLIGMAIADGSFHSALLAAIATLNNNTADVLSAVEQINVNTDTIITNNSRNAQLMISTLLQTSCPCDATIPLLPPALGTTPISATDEAKCRRIQYFLDLFRSWVILVGRYIFDQGSISSYQIDNLLQVALNEVGITSGTLRVGIPTSTRDSIVSKLSDAIGGSLSSIGAANVDGVLFNLMVPDNLANIRDAMYTATTAAAGKSAFDTALVAQSGVAWHTEVVKAMFYAAWPNDIYSDVPVVDDSAYDGTICASSAQVVPPCVTISSVLVSNTNHTIYFPPDSSIAPAGDFYGSVIRIVSGQNIKVFDGSLRIKELTFGMIDEWTVDVHTSSIAINVWRFSGGPFTIEWCDIHNA